MDDHHFLTEILHDAQNMALRLVYADWLEEQGDARAEFLRLDVNRRELGETSQAWQASAERWRELRENCPEGWVAALDGPQWSLVGNIVAERRTGVGGLEIRRGTKHFTAGTKVYCFNSLWGDGYSRVKVVGRARRSKDFITVIIRAAWITNWRAKLIYEPAVLRLMEGRRGGQWTQQQAEDAASWLNLHPPGR